MSTRLLKKFQKDAIDDFEKNSADNESSDDRVNSEKSNLNRFDLLSQSESEVKEENEESEKYSEAELDLSSTKKKKRRKRKKDLKIVLKSFNNNDALESNPNVITTNEIESKTSYTLKMLKVFMKHLNYNNEKAHKFGDKAALKDRKIPKNSKHNRVMTLVTPNANWPRIQKPEISMKFLFTDEYKLYFKFEHSVLYQEKQRDFYIAVESLDPKSIEAIFHKNPYHVDALIQLSEYCKLNEDIQLAAELIERGVYFMSYVKHQLFSFTSGNCHLLYKYQENRSFFVLIFKHILNIGNRCLYRTAFELSKLLFLLDTSDPLATLLFIDYYAIKTREYKWLLDFYNHFKTNKLLFQLPNFAFSVAIANFYLKNEEAADQLLKEALKRFPQFLIRLLNKCNVKPDQSVYDVPYFKNYDKCPKSLSQFIDLYVYRNYSIWCDNRNVLIHWLERNVHQLVNDLKQIDPDSEESKTFYLNLNSIYRGIPKNLVRHLLLADLKDAPPVYFEHSGPVFIFDPIPPKDGVNIYQVLNIENESRISTTSSITLLFQSLAPNFNPRNLSSDETNIVSSVINRNRVLRDIQYVVNVVRSFISDVTGGRMLPDAVEVNRYETDPDDSDDYNDLESDTDEDDEIDDDDFNESEDVIENVEVFPAPNGFLWRIRDTSFFFDCDVSGRPASSTFDTASSSVHVVEDVSNQLDQLNQDDSTDSDLI